MEPAKDTDFFFRLWNPYASGSAQITPESFTAKEVGELLVHLEAAFKTYIEGNPVDNSGIQVAKEGCLSLVEVRNASLGLNFKPFDKLSFTIAFLGITTALSTGNFQQVPPKCAEHLQAVQKVVKSKDCEGQFFLDGKKYARLTPETNIEVVEVRAPTPIRGETVLYGKVTRIGGVKPAVQVDFESGPSLTCMVSHVLAKQLGANLYSRVALKGIAAWSPTDYELLDFRIESFTQFKPLPPKQAFDKLRENLGPYWDKIGDIDNYLLEA